MPRHTFRIQLENLINSHNMESGSNTPDFVLARYLESCLTAFDIAVNKREEMKNNLQKTKSIEKNFDKNMPILIVTDYKTMFRIIRNLLKQLGFENVTNAKDGEEALIILRHMPGTKYGLVISNWNIEPMSGLQLLKEIRSDENLKDTPFLMITAEMRCENSDFVEALEAAGVSNYIVKPFNAATLKSKITTILGEF